jgi:flagellar basal body-associated protein FliL
MFASVARPARPARSFLAIMLAWLALVLPAPCAFAEGGDKAPAVPYLDLGKIRVNLQDPPELLELNVILKFSDPLLADAAKSMTPVILHQVILQLSNRRAEDFSSTDDKKKIMAEVKAAVNKALAREHRTGASEVLLASFVID